MLTTFEIYKIWKVYDNHIRFKIKVQLLIMCINFFAFFISYINTCDPYILSAYNMTVHQSKQLFSSFVYIPKPTTYGDRPINDLITSCQLFWLRILNQHNIIKCWHCRVSLRNSTRYIWNFPYIYYDLNISYF